MDHRLRFVAAVRRTGEAFTALGVYSCPFTVGYGYSHRLVA